MFSLRVYSPEQETAIRNLTEGQSYSFYKGFSERAETHYIFTKVTKLQVEELKSTAYAVGTTVQDPCVICGEMGLLVENTFELQILVYVYLCTNCNLKWESKLGRREARNIYG